MSFPESDTVEQVLLDATTSLGSGAGSSVLGETAFFFRLFSRSSLHYF
ncbi:hypothetical protein SAMN02745166_01688 [Prosthecobacter debontii]|uniref:Uncharacterized protein n=1 Tax=Prosthecobacter debontii TaxID=48467 RepID=A0A1T4XLP8_9BACT|nr:hypothetical protein [Prosthecobacter debontii]SKA90303.1 hypothetical protein SAMN02745166_01688 [Prosthecobacter debontii]